MSKHRTSRGQRIDQALTERGYTREGALFRRLRRQTAAAAAAAGLTRREFIARLGVAGAAFGAPALLASCGGDDDAGPAPGKEKRTLFFNLSHLGSVETTHYLYAGGRKHRLSKIGDAPQVLEQARQGNEFLRSVADNQITHHVEGAEFSTSVVALMYLACNEQPDIGTWEMTGIYFNIPPSAMSHAYARAHASAPGGPLALSNKRGAYGIRAANSEQDLRDEYALLDTNSHAETLVGLHPDLLSLEPTSAAHVHGNYISQDANTQFLAGLLQTMGPAAPPGAQSINGATPWATLTPLMDFRTALAVPFKKSDGKLNQYSPDWHPQVDRIAGPAIGGLHLKIKDDESLGGDVTGMASPTTPDEALRGKLWHRCDGVATVVQGASGAAAAAAPAFAFNSENFDAGLGAPKHHSTVLPDGRVQVELTDIFNWFLRFLGVYVRFYGPDGSVIPRADLPLDTIAGRSAQEEVLDQKNALFLGVLPPAYTVCGIPVGPGFLSEAFKIPKNASKATLVLGGAGLNGSNAFATDPDSYEIVGSVMTYFVNFALVALFAAIGASKMDVFIKVLASLASALAGELVGILGALFDFRKKLTAKGIVSLIFRMLDAILIALQSKAVSAIYLAITAMEVDTEIEDGVPVAGQVARAVAAAIGTLTLIETALELEMSPPVYWFDGVLTHDLSVNILPDAKNKVFPTVPTGYTLYYKVSYLFDSGTAYVQDAVDVPNPGGVQSIPITFAGIPRGGQVSISIGFYARQASTPPGQNDWCAGKGTTGLFDNTLDQAPDITIEQIKVPIQAGTQYLHNFKTTLDAQGRHVWSNTPTAPPYVAPPDGQTPGLGDFRSITVRQGTSVPLRQGYVGYAWKAFSSGVTDCNARSPGQLDQLANLNTDTGNGGTNAQNGYVNAACGLQVGTSLGYSLLMHSTQNFYLDSSSLHIRQVMLDPPAFANPLGGQSFGMLNLDSTRLLLHPAGHVVSINNENNKLETLKLPSAALSDADAATQFLARSYSGTGTRPGLMTSPVAAAISPDGAILVLEGSNGNNRIQAFDLGGNPVPFFTRQAQPYFLQLDASAGAQYLDLAVEFTGYLYVLSKDGDNNHRLDIYHPGQSGTLPICSTRGVNAANLTVDFWRSMYTLNYEVLQLPDGTLPPITEPSVSQWLPPLPAG